MQRLNENYASINEMTDKLLRNRTPKTEDSKNTDESWIESMTIKQIMKKLNDKEKMIITKRFFDGRTQMEVADEIGISQAQVSRLEKKIIESIKKEFDKAQKITK